MCARVVLSYPSFTDVTPRPGGSSSSPEIPCEIGGYESRTRRVSHPPALLSFQYKWATSNSVPATNALLFPDPTLSKPHQMVSIVFKAVYFFLAVFALPHVLAAPGAAAPDLSRRSVEDETLSAHFMVRRNLLNPRLEWDGKLGARASSRVASCNRKGPDNTLGGSSNGYPYLPRVLTLEPIENLSNSNSITDAVLSWANGNSDTRENKQVLSENTTKVGCAIGNCPDGKFVVCAYNGTPSISILREANSHGFFFLPAV